ncbi:hypothetical protein JCM10212_001377 [Sporobolomyces blumeae]
MSAPVTFLGVPLSLISLVTLTVQNSALTIVLHYSRISVPKDKMYSAASAVLLNELLKGFISLSIAFRNAVHALANPQSGEYAPLPTKDELEEGRKARELAGQGGAVSGWGVYDAGRVQVALKKMMGEVFSNDCWKLSIPACLYVIQNNLQFVAASNLDVPTFQVTYNLKILTTALFSVVLLRRRLSVKKWFALLFLAAGVGVVQLQSTAAAGGGKASHGAEEMDKFKGLLAVGAACMTSGLAGVYFEMVLKGSKADLWIRNVQLSFFSLLPALFAVFAPGMSLSGTPARSVPVVERQPIFANFGIWAWSVVLIQVFGGLITALVIRYSDNIMKGFATSLAIVLSFIAGVILFDFNVTTSFLVGTAMVVTATYLYNAPDAPRRGLGTTALPSSNPSTPGSSISARGSFSGPATMSPYPLSQMSSPSSTNDASYPPQSPAFAIHSSNAQPGIASNPAYRRANPTYLPPGAQTPDVSVTFQSFSPLEHATAPSAPVTQPNSVSHSASSSLSISRSTTPIPGVSSRIAPAEGATEGGASSGMDLPTVPGSPDPKRRGASSVVHKFS